MDGNRNGGDRASSSTDLTVGITEECEQVSIGISDEKSNSRFQRRQIEKVQVSGGLQKECEQVVSFGPQHHGKKKLKLVEDFKPKVLEDYVLQSGKQIIDFKNAGPQHHGKKKLKLVEDFKPKVLEEYVLQSGKQIIDFKNAVRGFIFDREPTPFSSSPGVNELKVRRK
ncbi:hypothetical protein F0562_017506 [Nyssa sinensis]|uniref:Uncharacterized protein n=1 Tax=Nyssa sinensis TaxID=561372 RepID=A0A5J4ZIB7_9ASTE|nr:hypothetical protein F0562_017506 [Nyssa sinensis]